MSKDTSTSTGLEILCWKTFIYWTLPSLINTLTWLSSIEVPSAFLYSKACPETNHSPVANWPSALINFIGKPQRCLTCINSRSLNHEVKKPLKLSLPSIISSPPGPSILILSPANFKISSTFFSSCNVHHVFQIVTDSCVPRVNVSFLSPAKPTPSILS